MGFVGCVVVLEEGRLGGGVLYLVWRSGRDTCGETWCSGGSSGLAGLDSGCPVH